MLRCMQTITILMATLSAATAFSQVVTINHIDNGQTQSPTYVFEWPAKEPQAVIIAILGGSGSFGLHPDRKDFKQATAVMLRDLAISNAYQSKISIVAFDSPIPLNTGSTGISGRYELDHLSRIKDVISYYKNKTKLAIWLMGHSNGTISVTEYVNQSQANREQIRGFILSGGRSEALVKEPLDLAVLMMHHESDFCKGTPYGDTQKLFKSIQKINSQTTQFVTISGGSPWGSQCTDGHHMYKEAYDAPRQAVEKFILERP